MDEELARVTPSMLRRGADMCRRRLARELAGGKKFANKSADMRFAVSNRIDRDAAVAQTELGLPRPDAFVEPRELEPEQQAVYRAARAGYLRAFGDIPGRVVELPWDHALPALECELVANPGLAVERADGGRELRRLHYGRGPLLDDVDVRVALVQSESWAPDALELVAIDLIELREARHTPQLEPDRADALAWIAERVALLQDRAADGRPRAGSDCQGCPFIAGCSKHA